MKSKSYLHYIFQPLSTYFILGLLIVNIVALFSFNPFFIGSFLSFIYIVITPGFLLLPLLTKKQFPAILGLTFSVALSMLQIIVLGLFLNYILPLFGLTEPLTTVPLLITFNALVYILLIANYIFKENSPFEFHDFKVRHWFIVVSATILPILACLGAIRLNNGGSNMFTIVLLCLVAVIVPVVVFAKEKINPLLPPTVLYAIALAFLFMNSMRGWFITGHDILLEYNVFKLTNTAHLWDMALYQDPYMACLSLTVLPTFLQQLIHVNPAYIFKFFFQFIGALPVVIIYYISKQYTSSRIAFLTGFLYVSFPTFMVDMAFLNRQSIAFLFFGSMLFAMLNPGYFGDWRRHLTVILFGIGIVVSHYSTAYITVALLIGAYVANRVIRFSITRKWPKWYFRLTHRLGNREMYDKPILLNLFTVVCLLLAVVLWSSIVTKTSTSAVNTIKEIVKTFEKPLNLVQTEGPAKYSLISKTDNNLEVPKGNTVVEKTASEKLFDQFIYDGVAQANIKDQTIFFSQDITSKYSTYITAESLSPLTATGLKLQSQLPQDLYYFYNILKQTYAKVLQVFLIIGLVLLVFGSRFRNNLTEHVPIEYIALTISGIFIMGMQTILPASAINYGLLRLFQQNLVFIGLVLILGSMSIFGFVLRKQKLQLVFSTTVFLVFFVVLSGLLPQTTGGNRPLLFLSNQGVYKEIYYTHAEEVSAFAWLKKYADPYTRVQSDRYFSNIKMISYANIAPLTGLIPETIQKNTYVYLNYNNVKTGNVIEYINGDISYYHFPKQFLTDNKNLLYNNGGSELYR